MERMLPGPTEGLLAGCEGRLATMAGYPVSSGDLVATVYHLIGIDPEAMVPDPVNGAQGLLAMLRSYPPTTAGLQPLRGKPGEPG